MASVSLGKATAYDFITFNGKFPPKGFKGVCGFPVRNTFTRQSQGDKCQQAYNGDKFAHHGNVF